MCLSFFLWGPEEDWRHAGGVAGMLQALGSEAQAPALLPHPQFWALGSSVVSLLLVACVQASFPADWGAVGEKG